MREFYRVTDTSDGRRYRRADYIISDDNKKYREVEFLNGSDIDKYETFAFCLPREFWSFNCKTKYYNRNVETGVWYNAHKEIDEYVTDERVDDDIVFLMEAKSGGVFLEESNADGDKKEYTPVIKFLNGVSYRIRKQLSLISPDDWEKLWLKYLDKKEFGKLFVKDIECVERLKHICYFGIHLDVLKGFVELQHDDGYMKYWICTQEAEGKYTYNRPIGYEFGRMTKDNKFISKAEDAKKKREEEEKAIAKRKEEEDFRSGKWYLKAAGYNEHRQKILSGLSDEQLISVLGHSFLNKYSAIHEIAAREGWRYLDFKELNNDRLWIDITGVVFDEQGKRIPAPKERPQRVSRSAEYRRLTVLPNSYDVDLILVKAIREGYYDESVQKWRWEQ